ncbi:HsdM family class I SAM-dependent methyltransferase [Roseateles puraquae]|uniref:site-specific DNA-methyltransferase (adenine-specific) n=1 Tax=Roseateles puraquae TaxID=431059 RepID=A0A254NCS7_9BURK|nr:N-6 DNA methylase [Roseateles puraquae]MDG0853387.1 SAM-dependent methyltransferase [Roseateles puraquae]OWR02963.1 SAM-dependent methyltransferase [Roseateles puraquae]
MSAANLEHVLSATGYLPDGKPAAGLRLGAEAKAARRGRGFAPDALWRSTSSLTVYFKFEQHAPSDDVVSQWRREVWNEGFAPLLWVISPQRIDLYNGFGAPVKEGDAQKHLIRRFENIEASLIELDELAGRLAIETGQFWAKVPTVDRRTSVDQKLLADLAFLEHDLVAGNLARAAAQALIGRVIFTQYLIDREIVSAARLKRVCGHLALPSALRDRHATAKLFAWLAETFNGDMFPPSSVRTTPAGHHLKRVADFLEAVDPQSGQLSFFPYQFDVIPVELISSIYEQFAHAEPHVDGQRNEALRNGVHYTRLSVVSLVLDEVMDGLTGNESVLDLTCGSGVFLVEALRRLVHLRANGQPLTRDLIRSTLYKQVYGVDISDAAIRVAAFSLYLAALELDPDPQPPHSLKFQPLIGKTLLVGDARSVESQAEGQAVLTTPAGLKTFDLIVGNPPWSFKGQAGTAVRRQARAVGVPAQPRGEGLDFVLRASEFAHEKTRFGVILSATPFFSRSGTGMAAAQHVMRALAPVTLVNLSNLCSWLFATAAMPAVVLFARHRPKQRQDQVTVVQIPWTPSGARTHAFEVAPSDVIQLTLGEIEKQPLKLKAAAVGRRRDLMLLQELTVAHESLAERLSGLDTKFRDGLTQGSPANQTRDAHEMRGLALLQSNDMQHFHIPGDLQTFNRAKAQWPRSRDTYRAPLLIVKEMVVGHPRATVAVADRDLVFTDSYFGVSLPSKHKQSAHLLATILSSSLASWFFGLTASEFGIYKRKLLMRDVGFLPVPDFKTAINSDAGKRLLAIEQAMRKRPGEELDWIALDEAVFDLYELTDSDRVVVRDGHLRAGWQWEDGRAYSALPCDSSAEVTEYAKTFLSVMNGWFSARRKRHMRAEVIDLPRGAALRVVRFVVEEGWGESDVATVTPLGPLADVLARISRRLKVQIATALNAERELRIHGRDEVVIIKPAARRHWMGVAALEDADAVVAESFSRGGA